MNEMTPEETIARLRQQLQDRELECQDLRSRLSASTLRDCPPPGFADCINVMFAPLQVGMVQVDLSRLCIVAINPALAAGLGYGETDLVGQPLARMIDPQDLPQVTAALTTVPMGDRCPTALDLRLLTRIGDRRWTRWHMTQIAGTRGERVGFGIIEDCHERYQVAQAWHEHQHRYLLATSVGKAGIWDWDLTTQTIYLDTSLKQLLGYADHDIANHMDDWWQYVYPADRPLVEQSVQQHLTGATPIFEVEHRMCHRDGSLRWFLARGVAVRNDQGQPVRILGTDTDITPQKQAQAALQASEARFRALFEQAGVGIAQVDSQNRYVAVNQRFCDLVGYTAAELYQTTIEALTYPEDWPFDQQQMQTLLTHQAQSIELEKRLIHRNGDPIWIKTTISAIRNDQGQVTATMGIVADMREQRQAAERLRRSQAMLRAVIDNVPQRIFWKNRQRAYLGCNQAQAELLGLASPDDIVGLTDADLPLTSKQRQHYCQQDDICLAKTIAQTWIYQESDRSGQSTWTRCHKVPIFDTNGEIELILGTASDVTEQKQVEAVLRSQARRERAINKVVTAIRQSLDLSAIFRTTVRAIVDLMNLDVAQVLEYQASQQSWLVVAEYRRDRYQPSQVGFVVSDVDNPLATRLKHGEIVYLNDAAAEPDAVNAEIAAVFPGAWLLVPLQITMEPVDPSVDQPPPPMLAADPSPTPVWGSLTLMRHPPQPWHPADIDTAVSIAGHLAIAIQQSQLYEQVQQLNTNLEAEVRVRTQELQRTLQTEAILRRLTQQLSQSLDQRELLNTALYELAMHLHAQFGNMVVYDYDDEDASEDGLPQRLQVMAEYSAANLPITGIILDTSKFPALYQRLQAGFPYQTVMVLPQCAQSRMRVLLCPIVDETQTLLGDLLLLRPPEERFHAAEVGLVLQVAHQCAIALRQARLYEAAQSQVQELERLNRLKDDFLSTVSHELRTPMASIQMAVQMLEILLAPMMDATWGDAAISALPAVPNLSRAAARSPLDRTTVQTRIENYLTILKGECQREIALINDLLDLSRLEAETEPLQVIPIQPAIWLAHVAEPYAARAQQQEQILTVEADTADLTITTDLSYLERVISELLTNACKYTPPQHQIRLTAESRGDRWLIQVYNSGSEIPPAECDRIFDKFYRIPDGDPWKHGGTGLGLALVRRIVQTLQGTITVQSDAEGVTFSLDLPQYLVPPD